MGYESGVYYPGHGIVLEPTGFDELAGFGDDDLLQAAQVFLRSCRRIVSGAEPLRQGASEQKLAAIAQSAISAQIGNSEQARLFFEAYFQPFRVLERNNGLPRNRGFTTAYYEPELHGSLTQAPGFFEPVLRRPVDLVNESVNGPDGKQLFTAARRLPDGSTSPYLSRAEIEAEWPSEPCLWLEDGIEVFMVQVQGSARIRLPDGGRRRLVYDGRNGRPYTSIGRILVTENQVPLEALTLHGLKDWVRQAGQALGQAGRRLLHRNESFVFFKLEQEQDAAAGPIGGEGVPLFPMRSLAVDRGVWAYGLPVWLNGALPSSEGADAPFRRLMIAQDAGTAIVGPARCDIFIGTGAEAGRLAARFRHPVDFFICLPKPTGSAP